MILKLSFNNRFLLLKAGLIFCMFSLFPIFFIFIMDSEFLMQYLKLTIPFIIFFSTIVLVTKSALFSYSCVALLTAYLAISSSVAIYLMLDSVWFFAFLLVIYVLLLFLDFLKMKKNNYYVRYQVEFNNKIKNSYYDLGGVSEFDTLQYLRSGTIIPKIHYVYLFLLPVLLLSKALIFKVSEEESLLNSNGSVNILFIVILVYAVGSICFLIQDFATKAYFSYKYKR